jgi:hypothetical protein
MGNFSTNPTIFPTSDNRRTIADCGTTLAYLVQEAYNTLVNAVSYIAATETILFELFTYTMWV